MKATANCISRAGFVACLGALVKAVAAEADATAAADETPLEPSDLERIADAAPVDPTSGLIMCTRFLDSLTVVDTCPAAEATPNIDEQKAAENVIDQRL